MKRNQYITKGDRLMWRRYRDSLGSRLPHEDFMTGEDANLAAAFLDGTLSDRDRKDFEARLARSPSRLDAVLAAHTAKNDDDAPAPDAVVTWARNLGPDAKVGQRKGRSRAGGRRFGIGLPMIAALSTSVALCIALVFSVVYLDQMDQPNTAKLESERKRIKTKEDVEVTRDGDLDDADNFFFKWDPD